MSLLNHILAVSLLHKRIFCYLTRICAKSHSAALRQSLLVRHQVYYTMFAVGVKFARRRVGISKHVARILDNCYLHTETYSKIRDIVFSRPLTCGNLALDSSVSKAAGNQNSVYVLERVFAACVAVKRLAVYPLDIYYTAVLVTAVLQCLDDRKISVVQFDIFAYDSYRDFVFSGLDTS